MKNLSVDKRVFQALKQSNLELTWEEIAVIIGIVVEENQSAYCQGYSRGYNDGYEKAKESV